LELTTSIGCRYITGFTYDAMGHLQLVPGTSGRCLFTDEGFVATFEAGARLLVPRESITFVEVRGDDEKHRKVAIWEAGLLVAALSGSHHRAFLAVGRSDGAELVFEVPDETASALHDRLAPLRSLLRP